ncbi:hypothetical protein QFZ30_003252 [Arthrobacter pascens]|nr:hypothetical protein [Arthrobacter pascens]
MLNRPVCSDQVDAITALTSVLSLVLLFSGLIVVRIVFMAGFLKMVLQLFFCIAAALTHRAHLLSRRRPMGVLVRAKVPQILAHTEMVSLETGIRKARSRTPPEHCLQLITPPPCMEGSGCEGTAPRSIWTAAGPPRWWPTGL